MEMRNIFKQNSQDIIEMCLKSRDNLNQLISLQEFSEIIKKFGFFAEDALVHLYLISFEKIRKVGKIDFLKVFEGFDEMEEFLKGIKRKYADIIKAIRSKMWNSLDTLDNFIGLSPEFGIPVNQFISSMQTLGIKVSQDFVNEFTQGKPKCDLSLFKALISEDLDDSYVSEFNFNFE
jgi:hypothetical protein